VVPAPIPMPKNPGIHVVKEMPLELIFEHLNKNELYRLSWGAKNSHGTEWEELRSGFETRLERMMREAVNEGWLKPQAVYGFFACQADGNDLIVYDPVSMGRSDQAPRVMVRFNFPRQSYDEHLAIPDYFASVGSDQMDVIAFQVVTVGQEATRRFDQLQEAGNYSEGYYLHGLAVQTAEATAEFLHRHLRGEMGIPDGQGKRYSWGYPAIPELEDHRKVFDLLPVEKELGMQLSPAYQLIPEQSTAALIVHHKDAKYFSTGESRVNQLMK